MTLTIPLLPLHPFNGLFLFSRTTWVSQYQKGKTSLSLNEARDDGVLGRSGISWTICKSAPRSSHRCCHLLNNVENTDRMPDISYTLQWASQETSYINGHPLAWLSSRVVSVLDSGAEGPGFKSQSQRCRVTVSGKLFTPIVPLRVSGVTAGLAECNGSLPPGL